MALAIPFPKFSGELKIGDFAAEKVTSSNQILQGFYLDKKRFLQTKTTFLQDEFENDLANGLYFDSDIPEKYGLGSSGALVAALYDKYVLSRDQLQESDIVSLQLIKNDLSNLESHFHGQSSGFDPLVSYINKPILLEGDTIKVLDDFHPSKPIYLLDTGLKGETEKQMDYFMEKNTRIDFARKFQEDFIPQVNESINSLINDDINFFQSVKQVSNFQLDNLKELFPKQIYELAQKGFKSEEFFLKLCGSGGGGYVLIFIKENLKLKEFKKYTLINMDGSF